MSTNDAKPPTQTTISDATRDTLAMYGIALDTPALVRWLEVIEDAVMAERERCARIADEVRHVPGDDDAAIAGAWRLASSKISQRIRHGRSIT